MSRILPVVRRRAGGRLVVVSAADAEGEHGRADSWHQAGGRGPRPPSRAAVHHPGRVQPWAAWWAWPLYRTLIDPDGRSLSLRPGGRF